MIFFLKLEVIKKGIGIIGVAIAIQYSVLMLVIVAAFSSVIAYRINSYYSGKFIQYGLWEQVKDISTIMTAAVFMGLILYLINTMLNLPDFSLLLLNIATGAALYWLFIRMLDHQMIISSKVLLNKVMKKEEYEALLSEILESNWLTNNGQLVQRLERDLKRYFELDYLLYVSNGTIALQVAMKALGVKGEVITTPFSYIATTSSIVWEGYYPVFVDIDPDTLNIDPAKIEDAITPKTSAIVATHVFGNPCDVEAIQEIAGRHGLKVIYDAAHCFGTTYKGESIFKWGNISTTSFHATKLFQTVEGGAVITKDPELAERMAYIRNFGHDGPGKFNGVGINGKNCELHAAMGLCNLKYIDEILSKHRKQCKVYDNFLNELEVDWCKCYTYARI